MTIITRRTTGSGNTRLVMFIVLMVTGFLSALVPWAAASTGSIEGKVIDRDTRTPLAGTTVRITDVDIGAAADTNGGFHFAGIPTGRYTLSFTHLGYRTLLRSDIVVRGGKSAFLMVELVPEAIAGNDIIVTSKYFTAAELQSASTVRLSAEELYRVPRSFGDVIKTLSVLPSVSLNSGLVNSLIVRGGNPIENGYVLDNINMPTIDHYPIQGSSGGGVGLLNIDFIRDVTIHVGGFRAMYGDRLSSFLDITYREGDRDRLRGKTELDLSGFRVAAEGPLPNINGSWLFSTRYSSLDLLEDQLQLYVVPRYIDYQGKVYIQPTELDNVSALVLFGRDEISFTEEEAEKHDESFLFYGRARFAENTAGVNWTHLWPEKGHTKTSLAYTRTGYNYRIEDPRWQTDRITNNSTEQDIRLRNINVRKLNDNLQVEFGLESSFINNRYDNYYDLDTEPTGEVTSWRQVDTTIVTQKVGMSADVSWKASGKSELNIGLRGDYFSFNKHVDLGPRLSYTYRIAPTTSLIASAGLYSQSIPLILLSQNEEHRKLRNPQAIHLTLGLNRLVAEDTRLSVAVYAKEYRRMPLDLDQARLYLLDELIYRYWVFYLHERVVTSGHAFARGAEVLLQKRLSRKIHCLLSASISTTRYRDAKGVWHNRVVDNRVSVNALVGFKPTASWKLDLQWSYAGCAPYTPFDVEMSKRWGTDIFDEERINAERLPPNHRLDLRIEKQFRIRGSMLTTYLSIWNTYDRENIYGYKWNEEKNKAGVMRYGGIVPILGLRYEF